MPSLSVRAYAQSRSRRPANTADASIGGLKRAPSSLDQFTTSMGRRVSIPCSSRVRRISNPASTPRIPSNLPPVYCVSRWLPTITGAAAASRPARRAKMFPILSTVTVAPTSRHHSTKTSRISLSDASSASRRRPWSRPGPMRADVIMVSHSRSASICSRLVRSFMKKTLPVAEVRKSHIAVIARVTKGRPLDRPSFMRHGSCR